STSRNRGPDGRPVPALTRPSGWMSEPSSSSIRQSQRESAARPWLPCRSRPQWLERAQDGGRPQMSESLLFPPSAAAKERTLTTRERYDALYAQSVSDPDAFWKEQSQRIDWIKPPQKIKNTSFAYPDVS